MLEVNGTLVVLLVSFLTFMWLLNLVFVKPVSQVLEARASKVEQDMLASKKHREEAEGVMREYEKHLAGVREKAQAIINEGVTEAQKKRTAEIEKIQADGRSRLDQAKNALAMEKLQLVDKLVDEEMALVNSIMHKLIGKEAVGLGRDHVKKTIQEAC